MDAARIDRLSRDVVTHSSVAGQNRWDAAAQTYDALASLHQSKLGYVQRHGESAIDKEVTRALANIYKLLFSSQNSGTITPTENEQLEEQLNRIRTLLYKQP